MLIKALETPNARFFHGAPTHKQAKDIFWDRLVKSTKPWWSRKPHKTDRVFFLQNGTEIHVVGLDEPGRIDGTPWHGLHITEIDDCHESAWTQHARIVLADTGGFAYLDGVPDYGLSWYYDLAVQACGGALPERDRRLKGSYGANPTVEEWQEWAYYHWYSSDVLPPMEIANLRRTMDEQTFRVEMEGSFESFAGRAYWGFGPWNIKRNVYQPHLPVHIGMDFNVNPMTATFSHIIRGESGMLEDWQFGEAFLRNSNTRAMKEHICKLFPPHMIIVYPDATGKRDQSSADKSDIDILKSSPFPLRVRAKESNPRQKYRIAAENSLLKPAEGPPRKFIDPSCKKTIEDFNKVRRKDDGGLDEKQKDEGLTHISDADGYKIAYLFPIRREGIEVA
jgi:hypothetical protein